MSFKEWTKFTSGLRFRITFVYSTLFGLFICIFAYIITSEYFKSTRHDFDANLINYAIDLSSNLKIEDQHSIVSYKGREIDEKKSLPFILNKTYYTIRNIKGQVISKSFNDFLIKEIPYNPALPLSSDYSHRVLTFKNGSDTYRAVNLKFTDPSKNIYIIQIATLFNSVIERERNLITINLLFIPLLIISSSVFSYLIAGNALSPIKTVILTANNIAAKNLSLRLPEINTGDEIEELTKTLNNLLARLDVAFQAQQNFVANASHQLNTPLAIIKGELAVLESKARTPEEITKFHMSLREELERLIELVKNMLLISRVKSGLDHFVFHSTRLDEVLIGAVSRLNGKAQEKKIIIRYNIDEDMSPSEMEVMGEKQLLNALFDNLIDNAIKYSPERSTIELSLKNINSRPEVWIQDEGVGMDEQTFEHRLKNRFERSHNHIPGTGIGLSISHKIAEFHNAKMTYQNNKPQGSVIKVRF